MRTLKTIFLILAVLKISNVITHSWLIVFLPIIFMTMIFLTSFLLSTYLKRNFKYENQSIFYQGIRRV